MLALLIFLHRWKALEKSRPTRYRERSYLFIISMDPGRRDHSAVTNRVAKERGVPGGPSRRPQQVPGSQEAPAQVPGGCSPLLVRSWLSVGISLRPTFVALLVGGCLLSLAPGWWLLTVCGPLLLPGWRLFVLGSWLAAVNSLRPSCGAPLDGTADLYRVALDH